MSFSYSCDMLKAQYSYSFSQPYHTSTRHPLFLLKLCFKMKHLLSIYHCPLFFGQFCVLMQMSLKPHLHGRLFCNAIRRFFMRENLSRKAVTHTRQDSLAAIAFGKNRCRVSNTCDLRCRLYFCATRCNNRSRP